MKTLTVIDDFYFAPKALLRAAQGLDYSTKEYEGYPYHGVSVDFEPDNIAGLISLSMDKPVKVGINYFRLGITTESCTTHIHSDNAIDPFAAVLYLNDAPEGVRAGTAFWRHKEHGIDAMPTLEWIAANTTLSVEEFIKKLNEDGADESKWDMVSLVGQKANRFVTYPSHLFHSRYPQAAWGSSPKDGRLIWTGFYHYIG